MTEDGDIYYEDSGFDVNFLGTENAIETRNKVAAMSPEQYEKYKQNLKLSHEYTEETQKAIKEGKQLYIRSGFYLPDAETIPGAQFYEYKFNGDIYDV
jgi:hypothetical protein